jgi:hypothetical protein
MSHEFLTTYLNDHLAGSQAALEVVALLRTIDDSSVWRDVEADISADRGELERAMHTMGAAPSTLRGAAAWTAEKLAEMKMRVDDPAGGALRRLELIEALAMGIDGKRALWTALQKAAERTSALGVLDYPRLIARADGQRRVVEEQRLEVAKLALAAA